MALFVLYVTPPSLGAARSRMTKSIDKSVMGREIGFAILPNVAMQADKESDDKRQ